MTNLSLNVGDFESVRAALANNLKSDPRFSSFDFNGANLSTLVTLLAYNTYTNLVYNNIAINESFRSSANIRRNVVARAEEVNYVPRSFRSASATIRVVIRSGAARGAIAIPKGTAFTTRVGNRLFTFTTNANAVASYVGYQNNSHVFSADVTVYEGIFASDVSIYTPGSRTVISNENVDTTSITVSVIEDGGINVVSYDRAQTAFDVTGQTPVYFLGTDSTGKYVVSFGNGVFGRQPKTGSTVVVEYRTSSGRLPNGANSFKAGQTIDGEANIEVTTLLPASSGDVYEDVDQIKFNASNSLRAQERATSEQDYATILQRENSDIIDVIATGGEKLDPPQYGKVFLSVASSQYTKLPDSRKRGLESFLANRSMMQPVIVDPEVLYLAVTTNVSYRSNSTTLTASDLQSFIAGSISQYAAANLGRFASTFALSKFVGAIDNAHPSITGNATLVSLVRRFDVTTLAATGAAGTFNNKINDLRSSQFVFNNRTASIRRVGEQLFIVDDETNETLGGYSVGTVNIDTGAFSIKPLPIVSSTPIDIIGATNQSMIISPPNTIIQLLDSDVTINIT